MANRHVLNSTHFSKQSTEEKNLPSEADRLFHVDLTPVRVRSSVLALVGLIHPLTVSVGGKKRKHGRARTCATAGYRFGRPFTEVAH